MQNDGTTNTSELSSTYLPDFAHICQSVTESLSQRNCLHLLFEDGLFKNLWRLAVTLHSIPVGSFRATTRLTRRLIRFTTQRKTDFGRNTCQSITSILGNAVGAAFI